MTSEVIRWREIVPLTAINGDTENLLATVDTLRAAWEEHLQLVSREEFEAARLRTLRRHAIETGIIERLYDLSWGVTEALVAEGITRQAAAREGGISEDTLAIINSQLEALEMLVDAVQAERPLTTYFVKELHAAIARNQPTYDARDQFGRLVQRPLRHGAWKEFSNDVVRADGSRLEFVPPEHVQSQMDMLLEMFEQTGNAHPVVRSAWLHHRFVCIHPFQDGNGRVARALTLLVLLRDHYAPLVVDRNQRVDYLDALDVANNGDLRPLVRLFAGLELVALKSELSTPVSRASRATGAVLVTRELVGRLKDRRRTENEQRAAAAAHLAATVQALVVSELKRLGAEIAAEFCELDANARVSVTDAAPGDERAKYWRGQIVYTANLLDFFADLYDGSWWTALRASVMGQSLRYLVVIQKVGHGNLGVLAVTTFAEVLEDRVDKSDDRPAAPREFRRAFEPTAKDSVTLVHTNSAQDRWPEIAELIDRTLSTALKYFVDQLS
ncbi:MAG TPA: Fic family protein [Pseudonocardiaceae bacterium]|nr:Fic family protein [Pseudonocardiaceae bacterium]